jgi:hypothetical protein
VAGGASTAAGEAAFRLGEDSGVVTVAVAGEGSPRTKLPSLARCMMVSKLDEVVILHCWLYDMGV